MATIPSTSLRIQENVTTHIQTAEQMSPTSLFKVHSQCVCTGGSKFLYAEHWSGIGFQTIHDVINHAHTADPPLQTRFSMSMEKLCNSWKQSSSVKLCTYIILHSDLGHPAVGGRRTTHFWPEGGPHNFYTKTAMALFSLHPWETILFVNSRVHSVECRSGVSGAKLKQLLITCGPYRPVKRSQQSMAVWNRAVNKIDFSKNCELTTKGPWAHTHKCADWSGSMQD